MKLIVAGVEVKEIEVQGFPYYEVRLTSDSDEFGLLTGEGRSFDSAAMDLAREVKKASGRVWRW